MQAPLQTSRLLIKHNKELCLPPGRVHFVFVVHSNWAFGRSACQLRMKSTGTSKSICFERWCIQGRIWGSGLGSYKSHIRNGDRKRAPFLVFGLSLWYGTTFLFLEQIAPSRAARARTWCEDFIAACQDFKNFLLWHGSRGFRQSLCYRIVK